MPSRHTVTACIFVSVLMCKMTIHVVTMLLSSTVPDCIPDGGKISHSPPGLRTSSLTAGFNEYSLRQRNKLNNTAPSSPSLVHAGSGLARDANAANA